MFWRRLKLSGTVDRRYTRWYALRRTRATGHLELRDSFRAFFLPRNAYRKTAAAATETESLTFRRTRRPFSPHPSRAPVRPAAVVSYGSRVVIRAGQQLLTLRLTDAKDKMITITYPPPPVMSPPRRHPRRVCNDPMYYDERGKFSFFFFCPRRARREGLWAGRYERPNVVVSSRWKRRVFRPVR